ncbi:MAG: aminodeoxychorismate synthase component I [Lentimicrobiaceae bacterium]|jgi:para-aminobenzoate synthetase component 1|nr:aminodeoxychorismate synthase component I [Lentimicrobiaceae bacterium]MCP4910138.1 aminodeoxychorismate synthase component I [Bacteroidota bacterium]MBT3454809.1 aminodeoxychorismate synthase component I [Lentimicrobiaceae bacterium]MBT3817808.1 aminodeoxychorismate synthase component I [Lentimicrobiaceae bacterium]MBT4061163.1 aminodeoxychorismate synthase component I [Lentimicrobiaceae bacterium]
MSDSPKQHMNELGMAKVPFLFIVDFDMKKPIIIPLDDVDADQIMYSINGKSNYNNSVDIRNDVEFNSHPVEKNRYSKAFNLVQKHIHHGDSFLLNLTMPSDIHTSLNLKEIFYSTAAKYKIWFKDNFVVYSPEIFVKTQNGKIHSFPMKGTILASLPNARKRLLESEKELAEHYTIVDLIRNDLSIVAKNVQVKRFRYIDEVQTHKGILLQMSSEIVGELPESFNQNIGDIIFSMLPAGSISGAPKKKTIEVIKQAENYDRGYYTGICGIFDGENVDSGVMIRYVEQTNDGLIYKSGGGITAKSKLDEEYQELMDKIYIPFNL